MGTRVLTAARPLGTAGPRATVPRAPGGPGAAGRQGRDEQRALYPSSRCDAARWARGQFARGGFQKEPLGQGVKLLGKRKATVSGSSRAPGRKP